MILHTENLDNGMQCAGDLFGQVNDTRQTHVILTTSK